MINRVLDLQSLTVRQIAAPLSLTTTVTAQTPIGEVLALARERGVTRVPVWEASESGRRIVGLISLASVLYRGDVEAARPVRDYLQPALYLNAEERLEVALQRMQRGGQRLAVVLGIDGTETGVISLEDILKVMFGEVKL